MTEMKRSNADLLTVWPTQITETWSERLCVPLIAMVIWSYLPVWGAHHLPFSGMTAANGQCMLWRRTAYEAVGGHASIRATVLDDVMLARRVKQHGLRLRMADGAGLVCCRMYTNWDEVRRGFAKNILAGYGGLFPLMLATLFHWTVFLLPCIWLFFAPDPLIPLSLILWGILIRALSAVATRQRLLDSMALPVSVLLMTWIAGVSAWWQLRYGGPKWKGRILPARVTGSTEVHHDEQ
jgi:chlorobactene glucosyltransferase